MELIHTTLDNVEIYVDKGSKSKYDFVVRYKEPGKRMRTPKHVHIITDLYRKHDNNPELSMKLRNHFLYLIDNVYSANTFPPQLIHFNQSIAESFSKLENYGDFTVEFLLVVNELLFIQEKTNYPTGDLTKRLYNDFGVKDSFSVINTASRNK